MLFGKPACNVKDNQNREASKDISLKCEGYYGGKYCSMPQSQAHGVALWTFERITLVSVPYLTCQPSFKLVCKALLITNPGFPLPQHTIRRTHPQRRTSPFFLYLRMTTSMVHPRSYLNSIHPHKVLRFIVPRHYKLLLTNWTRQVSESGISWDGNVFVFRVFFRGLSGCLGLRVF